MSIDAILAVVRDLPVSQKREVINRIGWSATRGTLDPSFVANATSEQWASAVRKTLRVGS